MSNALHTMITKSLRTNTKGVSFKRTAPLGVSVDGVLHGSELLASEWDAAKSLMKGVS